MATCKYIAGLLILLGIHNGVLSQVVLNDTLPEFTIRSSQPSVEPVFLIDSIHLDNAPVQADLARLLSAETGIYIKDYGVGNIATVSLRGGSAAHTLVSWNGIPMNSPTLGSTDLSLLPSALITGVSVHHGAGSVPGSAGGMGGALDIRTEALATPGLQVQFSYTPLLGAQRRSVVWSTAKDKLRSRTSVVRSLAENAFPYTRKTSRGVVIEKRENAASLLTAFGHATQLAHKRSVSEWNLDYLQSDRQIPSPIAASFRGESQYDRALRMRYKWSKEKTSVAVAHINDRQQYQDPLSDTFSQIDSRRIHAHIQHAILDQKQRSFSARLDADRVEAELKQGYSDKRNSQALSLQYAEHFSGDLDVDVTARSQLMNGAVLPLTGAIAVRQKVLANQPLIAQAIVSRNFRLPTFNDLYWPNAGDAALAPEKGWTFETGLRWSNDRFRGLLTYYRNEMERLIAWSPTADGSWRPHNVDQVRSNGIEVLGEWSSPVWRVKATYRHDRTVNLGLAQC